MSSADVCRWPKLYLFNQLCTNRAGLAHLPASKLPSELYLKKAESDLVYPPRNTTSHTSTYLQLLQLLVLQNLLTVNVSKMTDTLMWSSWRTVRYLSLQHSDCKPLTGNFLRQNRIAPYNPILTCEATGLVSASFLVWEIWLWNVWHFLVTDGVLLHRFLSVYERMCRRNAASMAPCCQGHSEGPSPQGQVNMCSLRSCHKEARFDEMGTCAKQPLWEEAKCRHSGGAVSLCADGCQSSSTYSKNQENLFSSWAALLLSPKWQH